MCAKSHSPGTESGGRDISLDGGGSRWWVRRESVEMQRAGFPNIEACLSYNVGLILATGLSAVPAHGHRHMIRGAVPLESLRELLEVLSLESTF